MKIQSHQNTAAFTMVEIALSLAIIGFALVAIMGVLPTGLQVQKTNREETLIDQDAAFYMEEIRSGDLMVNQGFITNALSGVAADRVTNSLVAFRYSLTNELVPLPRVLGETNELTRQLTNNLYELRLTFRWPVYPGNNQIGRGRRTFRTLIAGTLDTNGTRFQPAIFQRAAP